MATSHHTADKKKKVEKLSIRANETEKQRLRRAAQCRHMNVSQFVLQTSLEAADRIIREETVIRLDDEQYAWLVAKLDEPPKDLSNLRRLLNEPTVWNG